MKKTLLFVEKIFVVLALLIFSGAWVPVLYQIITGHSATDANEGILVIQIPFYFIYVITLLLMVLRWRKVIHAITKEQVTLILVGVALASIFWSYNPSITLRRSIALLGTTLFGMYLATRYSIKEQLHLLAWTLGLATVSSFMFCLAFPNYGIMHGFDAGSWQGVYIQKNVFGLMMVLSTLVFLLRAMNTLKNRNILFAGVALSVILIILSNSKNALVLTLVILILLPLYKALRWNLSWMFLFFIAATIVIGSLAILTVSNLDSVLGTLGKDPTFTGRTNIWAAVLDMVQKRPWLGYGYSAFWLGKEGESIYVWYAVRWAAGYSHNGFLDLLVELGLLGMLVYILSFLTSYWRAIALVRWTKTTNGLWPVVCLTIILLSNFSDGTILKQNNIFWVLYVAVTFSTSLWSAKQSEI